MATFAVLKSRVSKTLGLDETASGTEDVLVGYELNDAVRDFLLRTHTNVNRSETTIAAATDDSEISASVLAITDLHVTGASAQIWIPQRVSPATILQYRRVSAASAGGSARFFALNGSNLLMFYPAVEIGDVITMYYVPVPTEMSSASNDPAAETWGGIPVEYHPALIQYACWKMADYDDDGSSQMGLQYQQQYLRLVQDAKRWNRLKGGRVLGKAVLADRRVLRTSRSQDLW